MNADERGWEKIQRGAGRMPAVPGDRARLVEVKTMAEVESLHAAAAADGHGLLYPTHAVVRGPGNGICGAFSVGGVPLVTMWLGPGVRPRESFALIRAVEGMVKESGMVAGAVLVSRGSPFYGLMTRMGYREHGDFALFSKRTALVEDVFNHRGTEAQRRGEI